ncbi:hypothetical protein LUZ60_006334 [Juncus effusus]|nr:hypothetical protein LUZ60_006334 [Juncus effusus]
MPNKRTFMSGYEKRKKKERVEREKQSQRGAMNKYVMASKPTENPDDELELDEVEENLNDELDDEINEWLSMNNACENSVNEGVENLENEGVENLVNEGDEMNVECESLNIDDPANWGHITQSLRDLLVERGPLKRDGNGVVNFPNDEEGRHFSSFYYIRELANKEKVERKWLIYSKLLDKIFCFCCKLFKQGKNITQLANGGMKDWKNLKKRLADHECSNEHISCMRKWIELENRMKKKSNNR